MYNQILQISEVIDQGKLPTFCIWVFYIHIALNKYIVFLTALLLLNLLSL